MIVAVYGCGGGHDHPGVEPVSLNRSRRGSADAEAIARVEQQADCREFGISTETVKRHLASIYGSSPCPAGRARDPRGADARGVARTGSAPVRHCQIEAPVDIRQERECSCRMSTILTALAVLAATTPGLLVSPAELAASLKDPATVVIAVGNSEDDFIAGHIPGARFVRYSEIAIDADGLSVGAAAGRSTPQGAERRRHQRQVEDRDLRMRRSRRRGCSSRWTTSGTRTRRC